MLLIIFIDTLNLGYIEVQTILKSYIPVPHPQPRLTSNYSYSDKMEFMSDTRVYVSVIIRNNQGELLIIQRVKDSRFAPSQWEFVNGTIEPGETAEETAVREVLEETGLQLKPEQLIPAPTHELIDTDGRWIVVPFRAETSGNVVISEEHQTYKWITAEDVLITPYVGDDYKKLLELEKRNLTIR